MHVARDVLAELAVGARRGAGVAASPSNLSSALYSTAGALSSIPRSRRMRPSNCAAPSGVVLVSVRIDSIGTE
jgi:hypothetical protein